MKNFKIKNIIFIFVFGLVSLCGALFLEKTNNPQVSYATSGGLVSATEGTGASDYGKETKGSIYIEEGSTYIMTGGTMKGLSARYGSAFYVESGATLELISGSIESNKSKYGVIYVEGGGTLKISRDFSFKNNTVESSNVQVSGTALPVYMEDTADLVVSDGLTLTCEENATAIYDIEVVTYIDGTINSREYKELGTTFYNFTKAKSLNDCCGYFTDSELLDVLDENCNLSEEYQTGRLNIYTKSVKLSSGLDYELLSDNTYAIGQFNKTISLTGDVVLPATYNNLPISTIASGCFASSQDVTSYTLGSYIKTLEDGSFAGTKVDAFNIHSGINSFSRDVLYGNCVNSIKISFKNMVYADKDCNGVYTIDGKNLIAGCKSTTIPNGVEIIGEYAFAETDISQITLPSSIKRIESCAFSLCASLTDITMNDGITFIGSSAFAGCDMLSKVELPDSITQIYTGAFVNCTELKEINIPNSLTSLGNDAFVNCSSLTKGLVLPNSLTSMGSGVFYNCTSLEYVYLSSSVQVTTKADSFNSGTNIFSGCSTLDIYVELSETECKEAYGTYWNYYTKTDICPTYYDVVSVADEPIGITIGKLQGFTFDGTILTGYTGSDSVVNIPEGTTEVATYAFRFCTTVTEINCPSTLEVVNSNAFTSCTNLKTLNLNVGLHTIKGAFIHSTQIQSIVLPYTLSTIDHMIFQGAYSLESVEEMEESINFYVEGNCIIQYSYYTDVGRMARAIIAGCKSSVIPRDSQVIVIAENAFSDVGLEGTFVIPGNIQYIEKMAFFWNSGLTTVKINEGCQTIGGRVFYQTGLTTVYLPTTLTTINSSTDEVQAPIFGPNALTVYSNLPADATSVYTTGTNVKCWFPTGSTIHYDYGWTSSFTSNIEDIAENNAEQEIILNKKQLTAIIKERKEQE